MVGSCVRADARCYCTVCKALPGFASFPDRRCCPCVAQQAARVSRRYTLPVAVEARERTSPSAPRRFGRCSCAVRPPYLKVDDALRLTQQVRRSRASAIGLKARSLAHSLTHSPAYLRHRYSLRYSRYRQRQLYKHYLYSYVYMYMYTPKEQVARHDAQAAPTRRAQTHLTQTHTRATNKRAVGVPQVVGLCWVSFAHPIQTNNTTQQNTTQHNTTRHDTRWLAGGWELPGSLRGWLLCTSLRVDKRP